MLWQAYVPPPVVVSRDEDSCVPCFSPLSAPSRFPLPFDNFDSAHFLCFGFLLFSSAPFTHSSPSPLARSSTMYTRPTGMDDGLRYDYRTKLCRAVYSVLPTMHSCPCFSPAASVWHASWPVPLGAAARVPQPFKTCNIAQRIVCKGSGLAPLRALCVPYNPRRSSPAERPFPKLPRVTHSNRPHRMKIIDQSSKHARAECAEFQHLSLQSLCRVFSSLCDRACSNASALATVKGYTSI